MKISQTKDIRSANRLTIIRHILNKKEISRARISEETGLNKATVSTIVKEWMSLKLVEETTTGDSNGGRRPIILTLSRDAAYCIAIDIGARSVTAIMTNLNNEILLRQTFLIDNQTFSHISRKIYEMIDAMVNAAPPCSYGLIGISLAVRGIIDLEGVIRFIPKLQWHNIDIKSLLDHRYHVPVYIDNDGNLAASMESQQYPQYEEMTVLCLTDVISCGMISKGQLIRGYLGFANAVGHHTVNIHEAKQCSCGKFGCWEQYCSDQALLEEMNRNRKIPLTHIDEFIHLVKKQDPVSLQVLEQYIKSLAVGLSNIIFFLNSEIIVLNSHLIQSLPYLLPEIVKDIILPITHGQEIRLSTLGNEAPILGASRKAIEEFFEQLSTHGQEDRNVYSQ